MSNTNPQTEMTTKPYWDKYGDTIIGKMIAEKATSNSDEEITRCLSDCVCGPMLINVATEAKRAGFFKWKDQNNEV